MEMGTTLIYFLFLFLFVFMLCVCDLFAERTKIGRKLSQFLAKKLFGINLNETED